jgi:redox-sensitive bicupin YhaK (pirin superfamily)
MIKLRKADDRGHADHGWLNAYHTFSFADYVDRNHMGFGPLRVINEDRVAGGSGFGTHGHKDMEIITFIIEGALEHKDSMGNSTIIRPGEIQRMTAGTGVEHSEFNHFKDQTTHLLQIWIKPDRLGHEPSYAQIDFTERLNERSIVLLVSSDGREQSVSIHQNVDLLLGHFMTPGTETHTILSPKAWIQIVEGQMQVNGLELTAGDGLAIEDEKSIEITNKKPCRFLIFKIK